MKVPISVVIAFSITVFIFIAAGIANVGSTNEIPVSEEFKSEDWIVTGTETRNNEIITQSGNVIVQSGGNLTLDNVTLKMNCSYDGQYNIEVQDGGRLYAYNNSNITASTYKAHYRFWVRAGSILILENTSLSYCGYASKSDSDYSYGLYICSSNVLIRNCTLEENNWGIYYLQNTYQPGKARIENCIITHNNQGISVDGGGGRYAAPYIANNTISFSSSHGIYCTQDNSSIINNTISYNGRNGIFCYESYTSIENNSLLSNDRNGIEVAAGSRIEKITGNKIENSNYGIYCDSTAATTSISNIAENTILNGSVGIYCAESSVNNICNNTIKNFSSCGIHIIRSRSESTISWNNITECGIGIYCDDTDTSSRAKIISHNILSNNTGNGIYCRYSSPVISENNTISNNAWGIYLSGANATIDLQSNTFENNQNGIMLQEWYLKVRVRLDGEYVADAYVTVRDCDGTEVIKANTTPAGWADGWVAEYKILNDGARVNCTPHTITGYKQYVGKDSVSINIIDNTEDIFLFFKISDLMPTDLYTIGNLTEGNVITVGAHIYNNGTAPASDALITFLFDNNTIDSCTRNIAAQSLENVSVSWVAINGSHELKVAVDINNNIEERVEENNIFPLQIYVNMKPAASFTIAPQEVWTYEDVIFNASPPLSFDPDGSITEYMFDFGDGTTSGWRNSPIVSYNYTKGNRTYIPKLRVKDNFGAESDWRIGESITVKNRPPVPNITASATDVNTNVTIIFDGTGSYDGEALYGGATLHPIVNYTWGMGGDRYRYGAVISYSYSENGTYNVTLTVRDNDNEERTAFLLIVINNRLPSSLFSIEPVVGYVTTIFTLDASASYDSDGTVINYTWDFGDNSMGYGKIVTHEYIDDRNYTVKLTVRDNDLAEASTILILQILNTPPTALFSLIKSVVFVNEQVEFNASLSSDLDDAISNYTWDFGDGTKGYGTLVNHTYTQSGRYIVTLTVFDDEGNRTYTLIIEIKPLPTWIELHYKEVYLVGAIICIVGAMFFSIRWYVEARQREREVKAWAEKKGAEKEIKIEEEVEEWAEKKKKLKTIDERIKEWAKKREAEKKAKEEKVEKRLAEWAEKKEAKKKKEQSN